MNVHRHDREIFGNSIFGEFQYSPYAISKMSIDNSKVKQLIYKLMLKECTLKYFPKYKLLFIFIVLTVHVCIPHDVTYIVTTISYQTKYFLCDWCIGLSINVGVNGVTTLHVYIYLLNCYNTFFNDEK